MHTGREDQVATGTKVDFTHLLNQGVPWMASHQQKPEKARKDLP